VSVSFLFFIFHRAIADINPPKGGKCTSTAEEKRATLRAVKLNDLFKKFKQDEEEEASKENSSVRRRQ